MARTMARVYVGDIGVITAKEPVKPIATDINTDELSYREMCNLLVSAGIDVRQIIGKNDCLLHVNMILLADKVMPEGFNLFMDCLYCTRCWQLFRNKEHMEIE